MSDLRQRIANLSPEKRALLERRLMQQSAAGTKAPAIPRRDPTLPCPLSFAQQRLWFLDQFEPDSPLYNVPKAVRMLGTLDVEALHQALDAIVARHEALRTTFVAVDGDPVQILAEPQSVALAVSDLGAWPEVEREAEMHRQLTREAQRPFNLACDMMLRATLFRLGVTEHVLLLVMHHIASDGWSTGVLMRELETFYTAFVTGKPVDLPALPIQYADYAIWQRHWLQEEVLATQLAYWRHQLEGASPILELPTDQPRPAIQTYRGARQSWVISPTITEGLKTLSRREGVTLFMMLLAAWQLLLHRYTGQEDISVGSPIAGRTRAETEPLIGFFVNTLVLRTDLSGNPTFLELLQRVREVALGAYAHQDLPFEKLVEELQPERHLGHSPLFQVMFAFQNVPRSALELSGLTLSPWEVESGTAKFDMALFIEEAEEGLRGQVEYNTDLFDDDTICRMRRHLQTLLESIVANPEQRLADLPFLTAGERQQMLVAWNATQAEYPQEGYIHELVEAQVERTPEAVAVLFEHRQLTYRELNARANQLAHYLQKQGVGPEVRVGVCMERSLEMVVGLLGVLKAGGTYVPLDAAYPQERLAFMLEDTQAPVLLTQKELIPGLPKNAAHMLCLDADGPTLAQESEENVYSEVTADNLAYVIYTSGSTGQPKGVMIAHKSLVNYICWFNDTVLRQTRHSLPLVTKLTFDASLKQLFAPLLLGNPVWLPPNKVVSDPVVLLQALRTRSKVMLNCVPSLWEVMLDMIDAGQAESLGKSLTSLLLGGERVTMDLIHRTLAVLPQLQIWNLYGPTEATINASAARIVSGNNITIGRPVANTQLYILDSHLQPVPLGLPGELHIGGAGLARGYLHQPERTAERFIPHPFSNEPGARLYKTGDLARYRSDGTLEFLGRLDHQVKIRGFRIEPGEIEAVLDQHPAVRETIVLAREDLPGDTRLVAYVVPAAAQAPTSSDLRRFLQEKLPAYMVPAAFVWLDTLPLTPNGKVDRRALPLPDRPRLGLGGTFVAPSTPLEMRIAEVWQEVLGVDRVGVYDNFFDLGGHSLLSMRVMARLEKQLGLRMNPRELIQQNLGQFAAVCASRLARGQQAESRSFVQQVWKALKNMALRGEA